MRKITAAIGTLIAASLALTGTASAQDVTNGAYESSIDSVQNFVTGTAAGPLFLLTAAVVAVMVGVAWVRKARSAAK